MSTFTNPRSTYDAVVVGSRRAGAATAMLLARLGLRVLVVDRGRYGSDTLSTLALMRAGVFQLDRWGVLEGLVDAGTPPVRTTSFHYGDEVIDIAVKPRDGIDALYAPRRTVLDALLVDAARDSGVDVNQVRKYAEISGDYNPLHFDEAFVAKTQFGKLVVQGGLTTGLLHALVAMDMPGPGTVFLSQDWKFTAPVFIGDTITAEAEVLKVHETKPVTRLRIQITRQSGETVLEGETWCYTFSPDS